MPTFMLSNTFYMALQTDIKCSVIVLLLSPEIAVFFVTFLYLVFVDRIKTVINQTLSFSSEHGLLSAYLKHVDW